MKTAAFVGDNKHNTHSLNIYKDYDVKLKEAEKSLGEISEFEKM